MSASCPKCHSGEKPISLTLVADNGGKTNPPENSVVFHVKLNEVFLNRRKDGICPRCGNEPKTSTGYCRACTNLRARERRMLTTTGRPPGRPRKLTNG